MASTPLRAAMVRVPGSTSNLGSGFDTLGLALDRYVTVGYQPGDEPLAVERSGTLAGLAIQPAEDTLVQAFLRRLGEHGVDDVGGVLHCDSAIPLARGMGSSAAAVVAGLVLADAVVKDVAAESGTDARRTALAWAEVWEGHPDNVAPSIYGGLVAVSRDAEGGAHAFPLPLHESLAFAFAAPKRELATRAARAALPQSVPHALATRGLGRVAALVQGLATGDPALLRLGFLDELHVPYRLPLIPGGARALEAARDAGAWAATISGSGTGLIAVCPHDNAARVADAMAAAFTEAGEEIDVAFPMTPDRTGARILETAHA